MGTMNNRRHKGTFHVGVCRAWLSMPENASLKDKRQILRSLIQKVRNKFDVAIAEVDAQDDWHLACIGISAVSGDPHHANEVLSKVVEFIEQSRSDAVLEDYELEVQAW